MNNRGQIIQLPPPIRESVFWRNGLLFLREISQIHKEYVNEEIYVRPKVRIAVQLCYWRQNVDQITN